MAFYYRHKRRSRSGRVSNKNEGKVLRRLMSETGMCEEEVSSIKKYKTILSEAQKFSSLSIRNDVEKVTERILSKFSKKMKLPKRHPEVRKAFENEWKEYWRENRDKICEHYDIKLGEKRSLFTEKKKLILEGVLQKI